MIIKYLRCKDLIKPVNDQLRSDESLFTIMLQTTGFL